MIINFANIEGYRYGLILLLFFALLNIELCTHILKVALQTYGCKCHTYDLLLLIYFIELCPHILTPILRTRLHMIYYYLYI